MKKIRYPKKRNVMKVAKLILDIKKQLIIKKKIIIALNMQIIIINQKTSLIHTIAMIMKQLLLELY